MFNKTALFEIRRSLMCLFQYVHLSSHYILLIASVMLHHIPASKLINGINYVSDC